jgi:plastocyanin
VLTIRLPESRRIDRQQEDPSMSVPLRIPRLIAALGVAVALGATACSSSNGTTTATTSAGGGNADSIVDFAFNPASLSIKAGTQVTWTNTGGTAHTVTADDGSFDSGSVNPSGTFSHTFASAGTFAYHCTIHTSMTATITVTP